MSTVGEASRRGPRRVVAVLTGVVAAGALVLAAGWAIFQSRLSTQVPAPARALARLEPASGTYYGVNLDWGHDSAAAYAARLGRQPAVFVAFAPLPIESPDAAYLDGFIDQVAQQRAIALLTLEPTVALADISAEVAGTLASQVAAYNARGVPVMVRFAHEMNGSWYPWSQQPAAYVAAFRTIAAAVHAEAGESAMLWAPNYGAGYPFMGGAYAAAPGSPAYAELDTNQDGVVDATDDMYAPYYPGDDAVDWVGMTLYHWGDTWPWGENVVPEPTKFLAQLTGTYNGVGGDERAVPDFYQVYAVDRGKPLAVPETAAFYRPDAATGDGELAIKSAWWNQVFEPRVARDYPAIKMINWFEWRKPEPEVGNAIVDWTATLTDELRAAYTAQLAKQSTLLFGPVTVAPGAGTVDRPGVASQAPTGQPAPTARSTAGLTPTAPPDLRRQIEFSGYQWRVRSAPSLEGPGPNYFTDMSDRVWVDASGRLHLRLAPAADDRWYSVEVVSEQTLGYGVYQFVVDARLDALDPNVALGLFTWSDAPADHHRELDIEFARFGQPSTPGGRYTLQPYTVPANVFLFDPPTTASSTHRLTWTAGRAAFQSWAGGGGPGAPDAVVVAQHAFEQGVPETADETVHMNLWLDAGRPPSDGLPVEIVIRQFSFSPLR